MTAMRWTATTAYPRLWSFLHLILVLSVLATAGCASGQEPGRLPEIAFPSDRPLALNVAKVDVVSAFQASDQPPRVEERFPTAPETALRRWAADRLRAEGHTGTARFTITDAAVIRTELPVTAGLRGLVTREQSERYDATAAATLEILDGHGNRLAFVETRAERTRTVPEAARHSEVERIQFSMIETLMAEFDREMEKAVRQHLIGWLL